MAQPSGTLRTYVVVYLALLSLTLLTCFIAVQGHLGVWEIPVALSIASIKTVLVGMFFMHLIHSSRLVWLILATGVLFLVIMMAGTLTDYWTRGWMAGQSGPTVTQSGR